MVGTEIAAHTSETAAHPGGTGRDVSPVSRSSAAAEVAALAALLASYIWLWDGAFPGHSVVLVALYFGIGIAAHWRRGESAREVGVRVDNFGRTLTLAIACLAPVMAAALLGGALLGSVRFPSLGRSTATLAWNVLWGTAQQYGLLCVFYRRLAELLPGRWALLAAGFLFSLFHLPNPFLVPVTFGLGVLACWIYERRPNLFAIGAMHGSTSFVLFYALPAWLTLQMRVGPQLLHHHTWVH
jgi:membrane protease YdiL (CAAX protease family)